MKQATRGPRRALLPLAGFLAATLAACREASDARQTRGDVLATVNGAEVTRKDLEALLARPRPEGGGRAGPAERKKLLDELITSEILFQEAKARGYERHPRAKALLAGLLRADAVSPETSETIVGVTEAVTEEEIRRYYEEHRAELEVPAKVRVRRILVPFGEDRDASRARAEEIRAKAASEPEKFAELAAEHSNGPERQRQGELGYLAAAGRPDVDPRLVEAAFALADGEVSPVFETAQGWSIVQAVGRLPAGGLDSKQVRATIVRRLGRDRRARAFERFVAELRQKAKIVVYDDALAIPEDTLATQ